MLPELTAIGISFASLHIPYADQNQVNPGIHAELENYRVGYYRNSNSNNGLPERTAYVGYVLPLYSKEIAGVPVKLGVLAALDYGYKSPVIGALELKLSRLTVMVAPVPYEGVVFGFGISIPIKE